MTNTTIPSANDSGLNIDHLEALARAATDGPWLHRRDPGNPMGAQHCVKLAGKQGAWVCDCIDNADRSTVGGIAGERNAAFIAGANPAAVLALIALARRAQQAAAPGALDGWNAAAKALAERAAGHFRNKDFELQDECLQCASMLHDLKPAGAATSAPGTPEAPKGGVE